MVTSVRFIFYYIHWHYKLNFLTYLTARHNVAIVVPKEKSSAATTKKGTKRNAVVKMSAKALRDFGVEYSVSGRAHCCGCRQKIPKVIYNVCFQLLSYNF